MNYYYHAKIKDFLAETEEAILSKLKSATTEEITDAQVFSWQSQITILQNQLVDFPQADIIFEYTIPRMGKRVDNIILIAGYCLVLEFKVQQNKYLPSDRDQVEDYALDLRHFHQESSQINLIPILLATEAPSEECSVDIIDHVASPLVCHRQNLATTIHRVVTDHSLKNIEAEKWLNSFYLPTPTIIEAAMALYHHHRVEDITRNEAGKHNIGLTSASIKNIIKDTQQHHEKAIIFVTGVPGSGKTLVGLTIANTSQSSTTQEPSVYLSGNQPLVTVLQEALARDKVQNDKAKGLKTKKEDARRSAFEFIQIIHKWRDECLRKSQQAPAEKIVIFDEAQRAWKQQDIANFMKRKKGINNFNKSEPEFLIEAMDRHQEYAVIICLVGGGQEINHGEAGLPEWFFALQKRFQNWKIYASAQMFQNDEYLMGYRVEQITQNLQIKLHPELFLQTSIRSFRTSKLADLVKNLLDCRLSEAKALYQEIAKDYPIYLTRDLNSAKNLAKAQTRANRRYGLIASSYAMRLKAEGIFMKAKPNIVHWFLEPKDHPESSYYMEDVVSEFDIQGLEIDTSIVAWDGDLRFDGAKKNWSYHEFRGKNWNKVLKQERQMYLKNAYRVLLTRAREMMIIYVPQGNNSDHTRQSLFYDATYNYLSKILTIN
ncbi:MAG: DUF2075 domain-containing protein [Acholeplasmatales bacterium]|nr:DUF2075 domain-containing protein [Acholeplasmatales bacterium]